MRNPSTVLLATRIGSNGYERSKPIATGDAVSDSTDCHEASRVGASRIQQGAIRYSAIRYSAIRYLAIQ